MKFKIFTFFLIIITIALQAQKLELILPIGHTDKINSLQFSPDEQYLLTASSDNTVKLWEVSTGKEIKTYIGHEAPVIEAIFSPNGKYILSASKDKTIKLWNMESGDTIRTYTGHKNSVDFIGFSPDGEFFISAPDYLFDCSIKIWRLDDGEIIWDKKQYGGSIGDVAFSPDGKYFAASKFGLFNLINNKFCIWDAKTFKSIKNIRIEKLKGNRRQDAYWLKFSNDSNLLLSQLGIYDLTTFKQIVEMDSIEIPIDISDDRIIGIDKTEESKSIIIKNIVDQNEIEILSLNDKITSYCISKNNKYIAIAKLNGDVDIYTFDGYTANYKLSLKKGLNPFETRICQNQFYLYGGNNIRSFNLSKGIIMNVLNNSNTTITQDGTFAWYFLHDSIYVFNLETSSYTTKYPKPKGNETYKLNDNYIYQNPEGYDINLFDAITGRWMQTYSGTEEEVYDIELSHNNKYLATSAKDEKITLWDFKTGEPLNTFEGISENIYYTKDYLVFSHDSRYLATNPFGTVYDLESKKMDERAFFDFSRIICFYNKIAMSKDNKYIACNFAKGADLWDYDSIERLHYFENFNFISFSEDDKYIYFTKGGSFFVWDVTKEEFVSEVSGIHGEIFEVIHPTSNIDYIILQGYGYLKILNPKDYREIVTIYSIDIEDWIVTTPDGRFDASRNALDKLYYVKDLSKIPFNSLIENFYTPNLWQLAMSGEKPDELQINIDEIEMPPIIYITEPIENDTIIQGVKEVTLYTDAEELEVSVEVIDQGGGIDEICLYQNEKIANSTGINFKSIKAEGEKVSASFTIILVPGENNLKVSAFNNQRIESTPDEVVVVHTVEKEEKPNLYIIAVGINDYENNAYDLAYALPDAKEFVKTIETGTQNIFNKTEVIFIQNLHAKKQNIINALKEVESNAKEIDVFIFYYAGHGTMGLSKEGEKPNFYLVPSDITELFNPTLLNDKGISAAELKEYIKNLKPQKQLWVIDACNAGAVVDILAMRGPAEEEAIAKLAWSTGTYFLAATTKAQYAIELGDLGHGVFTYSIIEGLNCKADLIDNDQIINVEELIPYVKKRVPELLKELGYHAQNPYGYGFGLDFPLVICTY